MIKRNFIRIIYIEVQQINTVSSTLSWDEQAMLRKSSMENYKLENAPMVVRRSGTRTPSKQSRAWEQIAQARTKWRGLIRRWAGEYEAKRISRNVHSGKPKLRHHQQSFLTQTSLVLSATGSLELRLVSSAIILEHTNNNTSHIWLGWSLSVMTLLWQTNDMYCVKQNWSRQHFEIFVLIYYRENRAWHFMRIVWANEMSSLILSWK